MKKPKLNIELKDKGLLEKKTVLLKNLLEKKLDLICVRDNWPLCYEYKIFKLVFSALGSLTVLWNNKFLMKEIPVYHLSLSKNLYGKFNWVDLNGSKINESDISKKIIEVTKNLNK